ncbi:MAG: hypothetical protein H6625_05755 [Bdellovibrionaceae bacterium]|nr:hypothetical protein [Pseudobdellovibrionaceae bacterium]
MKDISITQIGKGKVFAFIFLNILISFFILVLIYQSHFFLKWKRTPLIEGRFNGLIKAMDEITTNPINKSLFLSSSDWQFFLDPAIFDSEIEKFNKNSTSYNLSIAAIDGVAQLFYIARLVKEFERRNALFKNIFLHFSPANLSESPYSDSPLHLSASPKIFFPQIRERVSSISNPNLIAKAFFYALLNPMRWTDSTIYHRFLKLKFTLLGKQKVDLYSISQLWDVDSAIFELDNWNIKFLGLSPLMENSKKMENKYKSYVKTIHKENNWEKSIEFYRNQYGLIERNKPLNQEMYKAYIEGIKILKKYAENFYIVITPYSPDLQKIANRSIDYDHYKNDIFNKTQTQIIDLRQDKNYLNSDFDDALYPSKNLLSEIQKSLANKISKLKQ